MMLDSDWKTKIHHREKLSKLSYSNEMLAGRKAMLIHC